MSFAATAVMLAASSTAGTVPGEPRCAADAMLVFDASGSMTGMGFGETSVRRIDQVRGALARVLPSVAPVRNLGLIVFGPGSRGVCENIELRLPVARNSADEIMAHLNSVQPYGQTPLSKAVADAAEIMRFRERPAVIVLLTDGEETCQGSPCAVGRELKREGREITVHVIGYMLRHASEPTGGQVARCLSEMTGGLFLSTETADELVAALQRTLGCDQLSLGQLKTDRRAQH